MRDCGPGRVPPWRPRLRAAAWRLSVAQTGPGRPAPEPRPEPEAAPAGRAGRERRCPGAAARRGGEEEGGPGDRPAGAGACRAYPLPSILTAQMRADQVWCSRASRPGARPHSTKADGRYPPKSTIELRRWFVSRFHSCPGSSGL